MPRHGETNAKQVKSSERPDQRNVATRTSTDVRPDVIDLPEPAFSFLVGLTLITISIGGRRLSARRKQNSGAGEAKKLS